MIASFLVIGSATQVIVAQTMIGVWRHEPVCLVPAWALSIACVLLEFPEALTHILTIPILLI